MNAKEYMANLFKFWLFSEPEIPLHEFLNFSREECDQWLKKEMTCEIAHELFKNRTGHE